MANAEPGLRSPTRRAALLVAIAALFAFGAWVLLKPVPRTPVEEVAVPQPAPTAPAAAVAPSFDVVRVGPQGDAVIAGRAAPGAEVVVRDGTQEVARTQADRTGSFVAIPAAPLPAGGRALTLSAREGTGAEIKGDGSVMVVVPPAATAPARPEDRKGAVAVLVPDAGPSRVLQPPRSAGGKPAGLGLDTVDYDEKGGIRFAGHAEAGSTLRVYVDNRPVGDAGAAATGSWTLTPADAVAPGVHALRVDRLDGAGRVLSRVELPFQRAALPQAEVAGLSGGRTVVQPGQNLWRMARAAYGSGVRYTVIYLANREQIRDPRLIYPGQAFSVPEGAH